MSNLGGHDMASMLEAFESDRSRPPGLLHRLHHQGRRPAVPGPQGQPCGPDDGRADGEVARRAEHPPRPRMGEVRGAVAGAGGAGGVPRGGAVQPRRPAPPQRARDRGARAAFVQAVAADVDPAGFWARAQRTRARRHASWPRASSPPRPTSRCRPISAPGSTAAACSRAPKRPICSAARRSPRPSTGTSRPRASTSSSASPR